MKDLKDWKKQLKTLKLLLISTFLASPLLANSTILSTDRLKSFDYQQEKINTDSAKQKIDWVNPITYTYKKSDGNSDTYDYSSSVISVSQPIFKSGGIYNAIKYSHSSKKYQTLELQAQKKALIKDTTKLLFQLHQIDLNIAKQQLQIKNSQIEVSNKQEEVLNGMLDVISLNNAIITFNKNKIALEDLKLQKQTLEKSFNLLASQNYTGFTLPQFNMIDKETFLKQNINIQKSLENENSLNYLKKVTIAKYLPTVNLTYNYTDYHERDSGYSDDTVEYGGINISIPLDIKSGYDIQSSKIAYLKSKLDTNIQRDEELNFIESLYSKIETIDNKIKVQKDNINYYSKLIFQMKELQSGGLKTSDDVTLLENSKQVETLNLNIYKLDKQLELLEAYARTK